MNNGVRFEGDYTGIVRTISHWSAGGGRANASDREHYHGITEYDGNFVKGNEDIIDNVVVSDGDYAAHTLNLNTGSAAFCLAGMIGAVESPFDPGSAPLTEVAFEAHCKVLAEFHMAAGIPVTRQTCLTHAEVQPTLGVVQRGKWDIARLPHKPELRGAIPVGDYMRSRVKAYMPGVPDTSKNRPTLRRGDRGAFVMDAQSILDGLGYPLGKIDGIFGSATQSAVTAFQGDMGLTVDGVIGPDTWDALMIAQKRPEREITEDDLRERGSQTIADADEGERLMKNGAGAAITLGTVDTVMDAADKLEVARQKASGAQANIEALQALIVDNWAVFVIVGVGLFVYWKGPQIMASLRGNRTRDAQTRKNMGR